jgi:hypothetical protein
MKLVIVKVQLPNNKLGEFLTDHLPHWAHMVGYDLLRSEANGHDPESKTYHAKRDLNWRPTHNTAAEAVVKILAKAPLGPVDIFKAYKGEKYNRAALHSGLYICRDRGIVQKRPDGRYELAVELKSNG